MVCLILQHCVEAREVPQDPDFRNRWALQPEERRAQPVHTLTSGRIPSKDADMAAGEPHLGERLVSLGDALKNLAPVVGQGRAHGSYILSKRWDPEALGSNDPRNAKSSVSSALAASRSPWFQIRS